MDGMESKLCMNCFAGYHPQEGAICPVCGWDNGKAQLRGGLRYHTVLASRYVVGRAKAVNGEGITYAALDQTTKRVVEIREFFPMSLAGRKEDQSLSPIQGREVEYEQQLQEFIQLSKSVSRLRELTVVTTVLDIFEENYTAYAVYEYVPAVSLRRYVENAGGSIGWNQANHMFMPVLTALGIINSLGVAHLGVSPDTLRVTQNGVMFLTGFSIRSVRQAGQDPIPAELFPGCAALEQYKSRSVCGEASDVYALAASMLFALTGQLPQEAPRRMHDQRLMISKDVLRSLPPYAVTAIANALQVKPDARTSSFERFKAELSSSPTIVNEVEQTEAIRRLPPIDMDLPQNRGLPPVVWLIGSCLITLVALVIVASMWLGDRGMSFGDLQKLFDSSSAAETVAMPNMVNQNYDEWVKRLENGEYDFKLKISERIFSETVAEGDIISQSPFQNEPIAPGDTVLVTVSKGSPTRTLPPIKGMSFADLQAILQKNGFLAEMVEEASEDIAAGNVIRYQDREEGDSLDYGSTVVVVVSSGPEG